MGAIGETMELNMTLRQRALYDMPRDAVTASGQALEQAVHRACAGDPRGPRAREGAEAGIGRALEEEKGGAARAALASEQPEVAAALETFEAEAPAMCARWRSQAAREGRASANAEFARRATPGEGGWTRDHLSVQRQLERWARERAAGVTLDVKARPRSEPAMFAAVGREAWAGRHDGEHRRSEAWGANRRSDAWRATEMDPLDPIERAIVARALRDPCPEEPVGSATQRMRLEALDIRREFEQVARERALGWVGMALVARPEGYRPPAWQEELARVYDRACAAPETIGPDSDDAVERAARAGLEALSRQARGRRSEEARENLRSACKMYEELRHLQRERRSTGRRRSRTGGESSREREKRGGELDQRIRGSGATELGRKFKPPKLSTHSPPPQGRSQLRGSGVHEK